VNSKSYHFGFFSFLLAVLFNLTGLFFLNLLLIPSKIAELNTNKRIQAKLKNYRTLGVKKAQTKSFSPPIGKKHKSPPPKPVSKASKPQQKLEKLNDLKLNKSDRGRYKTQKTPNLRVSRKRARINAQLRQQAYKQKQPFGLIDDVLMKSDFLMKPELPKGVPEDELNSIEKIYFGFQKRMYLQYVNTFIKTYNDVAKARPLIKGALRNGRHRLTARVVFDVEGNIEKIKIMRSSQDDDIHELFEKTLMNVQKVPNPPDDFINSENKFVIYYQLNIN
jgi:hypothetical protein